MANTPNSEPKRNSWRGLLLWVLLALLLRWQVIEPRWIPSGSMLPTLQLQDRIRVEKVTPKLTRQRHQSIGLDQIVVFEVPPQLVAAGYDPNAALINLAAHEDHLRMKQQVLVQLDKKIYTFMDAISSALFFDI